MPTYAYACKQCGHRFDAVQSFTEPALTECPECGGALRKEYGSIGVTFNGSGFYRTDSRAAPKEAAGAKTGGDDTSATKAGGGAESGSGASTASPTSSKTEAKASPASSGS